LGQLSLADGLVEGNARCNRQLAKIAAGRRDGGRAALGRVYAAPLGLSE
jgi:hypothetical protein